MPENICLRCGFEAIADVMSGQKDPVAWLVIVLLRYPHWLKYLLNFIDGGRLFYSEAVSLGREITCKYNNFRETSHKHLVLYFAGCVQHSKGVV